MAQDRIRIHHEQMGAVKKRPDRYGEHRGAFEKNRGIVLRTQGVCGICGQPVDLTLKFPDPMSPTVDHIIPVSKGGHPSSLENLQLAHRWCNRQKSDKLLIDLNQTKDRLATAATVDNDNLPIHFDWKTLKAEKTAENI